jgi:hypothetical protein
VDLMPLVMTAGWGSGINAYAVVVIMGVLGRYAGLDAVPESIQSTNVLLIAGAMYMVEFVTDKIPYVDSAWDMISTAIRPTVGAMLGYLIAGDVATLDQAWYAAVGGGTALGSHLVKTGLRLAVNASPEPVTNATVSLGEDITVSGVVLLALYHPWLALGIAATFFAIGVVLVILLFGLVRRGFRKWRGRRQRAYV